MTPETARGRHAEHELERALHARTRKQQEHEQAIRDHERRLVLALVTPEPRVDDTGFCEGGLV